MLLGLGVCEAHCQSVCRRQAGGGRGFLPDPVQAPPDGRDLRLGQRGHVCANLQDDRRLRGFVQHVYLVHIPFFCLSFTIHAAF